MCVSKPTRTTRAQTKLFYPHEIRLGKLEGSHLSKICILVLQTHQKKGDDLLETHNLPPHKISR